MTQNLALFDFDGTISCKDSNIEFLKFYSGTFKFYKVFALHTHWLILMFLGLVENEKVKEKIWISLFNNTPLKEFEEKAKFFSINILPSFLYKQALDKIQEHKKNGDKIIVVSASAEGWLKPWCTANGLELIATQLETKDGRFTGKIYGYNCKGTEKVNRLNKYIDLTIYNKIYAYGDSSGDKEMLELATHPFYKIFKKD